MDLSTLKNKLPFILFILAALSLAFGSGALAYKRRIFPIPQLEKLVNDTKAAIKQLDVYDQWYYTATDNTEMVIVKNEAAMQPGLTKITSISTDGELSARVIDSDGNTAHEWLVDWFALWPNASHLPEDIKPRSKPGTMIHGSVVTQDGSLIFNYDGLGLVRIDACSNVIWKIPEMTHHSLFVDDNNHLWAPSAIFHNEPWERLPNYTPQFREETILRISMEGEILEEISTIDLLEKNNLLGLMYTRSPSNFNTTTTGDPLHLNDVEIFSNRLAPGVFSSGDIMVSFRNINAVLVFDGTDHHVKYTSIGKVIRQHDPDFIDGNTISIFDNNNMNGADIHKASKITIEHADSNNVEIAFSGSPELPFYTHALGKHQWLDNGNLLLTESDSGRAMEVNSKGELVWLFENIATQGYKGVIGDAERLPLSYSPEFFTNARAACAQ